MSNIKGIVSLLVFVAAMTWISARLYTSKTIFLEGVDYYARVPKLDETPRMVGFCGNAYRSVSSNGIDGRALFKANCASCHHPTKVVVGPALSGTLQRWSKAGIRDKIYDWIRSPHRMSKKYPYTKNMRKEYNDKNVAEMPAQALSNEEIDAVLGYAGY